MKNVKWLFQRRLVWKEHHKCICITHTYAGLYSIESIHLHCYSNVFDSICVFQCVEPRKVHLKRRTIKLDVSIAEWNNSMSINALKKYKESSNTKTNKNSLLQIKSSWMELLIYVCICVPINKMSHRSTIFNGVLSVPHHLTNNVEMYYSTNSSQYRIISEGRWFQKCNIKSLSCNESSNLVKSPFSFGPLHHVRVICKTG